MPWFGSKKPSCYFCELQRGLFHSVHDVGIYGEMGQRLHYHPECLEMVETDPETFGHIMMDKALHINELRKTDLRRINSKLVKDYKKKVEKLHQINFERMMPRKT
jgi:hypothetical protein